VKAINFTNDSQKILIKRQKQEAFTLFDLKYRNVISKDIKCEEIKINELLFKVFKNMKCSNSVSDSVSPIEYFYNSFVDQKHKFENKDII